MKRSAGLLLFRKTSTGLEVFLGHPGGPLWAKKDENAWSIPKGEVEGDEDLLSAAIREFEEETGFSVSGDFIALKPVVQPSGKVVHAWALQHDIDAAAIKSNLFSMEWPPKSGKVRQFPEIDRGAWLPLDAARKHILKGQAPFLTQLAEKFAESFETNEDHGGV